MTEREKFGALDIAGEGLAELPCAERAGLVFVGLTPEAEWDIESYLGEMLPELVSLGMDEWTLCATQELTTANWKLAHDGYVDGYHIASLHPETIGSFSKANVLTYDAFGPHQRIGFAHHDVLEVAERPRAERGLGDGLTIIRTLFPNVALAVRHGEGGLVSQLFPGPTPDSSLTIQSFLRPKPPETEAERRELEALQAMLYHVVRDEDYATVAGVQQGLESGAHADVLFGRNELGNQRLHAWIAHYRDGPESVAAPSA